MIEKGVEQRVDARDHAVPVLGELLDEAGDVSRVGDQHVLAADHHHHQAIHRQREDVVERQRGDDHRALLAHQRGEPRLVLQQRRDHVAMEQHRALRDAGGAAGVLQERNIVVAKGGRIERFVPAFIQGIFEGNGARQLVRGNHLLQLADHQVDEQALQPQQLAERGHHDVPDRRARQYLLQHVGEVLEDHDRLGARIPELILQLARGVQGIDVHHRIAGAQHAEHGDRVLQAVRHHQRDARPSGEAARLQPGAEIARHPVELGEANRAAHVVERRALAVLADAGLEQLDQRLVFVRVDVRGNAGGIALQPDAFHVFSYRRALPILAERATRGAARQPAPIAA